MLDSKIVLIFLTIVLVLVILHTLFKVYLVKRTIKENFAQNPPKINNRNGDQLVLINNGEPQGNVNEKPEVRTNNGDIQGNVNQESQFTNNSDKKFQ